AGTKHQSLSVLNLSVSVDDSVWATTHSGAIYVTAGSTNTVYRVAGPFKLGAEFVAATPCNANSAPSTCPAPGFPANYLGELNPNSGAVTPVKLTGPAVPAQGMLFMP
ncbi:MAG: hypothetical protein JWP44_5175, partial [Mucilaginibacter sp.]|nr:hypothetical protein [Mucilaginibacter sp.]